MDNFYFQSIDLHGQSIMPLMDAFSLLQLRAVYRYMGILTKAVVYTYYPVYMVVMYLKRVFHLQYLFQTTIIVYWYIAYTYVS